MKVRWDPKLLVVEHSYLRLVIRASGAIDDRTRRLSIPQLERIAELAAPIVVGDLVTEHNDIRFTLYRGGKKYQTSTGRHGPLEPLLELLESFATV